MGIGIAAGWTRAAVITSAGLSLAAGMVAWASLRWPDVSAVLALDREALHAGEFWRLWTGHLVHLDTTHALINLAALAALILVASRLRQLPALLASTLLLMPLLSVVLLLTTPGLQWYVGLSGLLHGWVAWLLWRQGGKVAMAGFALLAAKLCWEALRTDVPHTAFPVVTEAHLVGAITGLVLAVAMQGWSHLRARLTHTREVDQSRNRSG